MGQTSTKDLTGDMKHELLAVGFVDFLHREQVYDKFLSAFAADHSTGYHLGDFLSTYSPRSWVRGAFLWNGTRQGHLFWADVNDLWQDEYNRLLGEFNKK